MKSIVYFTLFLMLLSTACTLKRGGNEFQHKLSRLDLQEDLSVSIDSINTLISGTIPGIAVDSRGNIYLQDWKEARIHILSSAGRYLQSLGQRGNGPGEFQAIFGIYIYNNILYVLDTYLNRLSEFRLDNYQLLRTVNFPDIHVDNQPIGEPQVIYPLSNRRYEMVFRNRFGIPDPKVTISILNHDLAPVDTSVRQFLSGRPFLYRDPPNGPIRSLAVFSSLSLTTLVAIGPRGYVYQTNADSMHIRVFDSNGEEIRNISARYIPPLLTDSDLDSLASRMSPSRRNMFYKALNQNKVPNHWQALQELLVDDQGRIWVELVTPGKEQQTWWVFDTDGKPNWKFKLSRHLKLYLIRNNKAYGIWKKEGKYPRIMRYHMKGI